MIPGALRVLGYRLLTRERIQIDLFNRPALCARSQQHRTPAADNRLVVIKVFFISDQLLKCNVRYTALCNQYPVCEEKPRCAQHLACNNSAKLFLQQLSQTYCTIALRLAVWLSGNAMVSINVLTLRRARLVPGLATAFGQVNYLGM